VEPPRNPQPDAAEGAAYVTRRLELRNHVTADLLGEGAGKPCDCLWCGRAFRLPRGARPALYCGADCRAAFLRACRNWRAPRPRPVPES